MQRQNQVQTFEGLNQMDRAIVEIQEFLENQEIAWMKECVGIFFIAFSARKLRNQLIR